MSTTDNPLIDMTDAMTAYVGAEEVPGEDFRDTALPGFKQTLTSRRSIRVFDGEPIPEEVMRDCLRDATLAPSSSNLQPYELYWVRDSTTREKLVEACLGQPAAATAGELIVVMARRDQWRTNLDKVWDLMTKGGTKTMPEPVDDYYHKITPRVRKTDALGLDNLLRRVVFWFRGRKGATVRSPVNTGDHRVWAHTQSSLTAMTLMLSLTAHGYDTCPIGGLDKLRIRKMLGLPDQAEVTMVIAAGRRRPEGLYSARVRLPYGDLIKEV
ncbi:MAG: nitroreductase family protein [Acidimicrobiales bacterium]|nr:nitroreductase family protein [Acidimicrobiales bacterium]